MRAILHLAPDSVQAVGRGAHRRVGWLGTVAAAVACSTWSLLI